MHAARAIKAQRQKKQEQKRKERTERRGSATSVASNTSSVDLERLQAARRIRRGTSGVSLSYVGFFLALAGFVPLILGTFMTVPALFEIGLVITISGMVLGTVFWCKEFWAQASSSSHTYQSKSKHTQHQRPKRGKVQDVPPNAQGMTSTISETIPLSLPPSPIMPSGNHSNLPDVTSVTPNPNDDCITSIQTETPAVADPNSCTTSTEYQSESVL